MVKRPKKFVIVDDSSPVVARAKGSFSSDDGDGGDDAGLKNDFNFTFECRNSVNQFSTPIDLKICSG